MWNSELTLRASGLWGKIKWGSILGVYEYRVCVLDRETQLL